jgi:alkylhydroperoxidase family enzyme
MARLRYVERTESPRIEELYARVGRLGRPVLNLYRILANQPAALDAFLGMSAYVRSGSTLEPQLRELVILATAHELGQEYELAQHTEVARRIGVPPEKVAAITGHSLGALDEGERCAVEYARQVARTSTVDDATFECLRAHFSDQSIIDIVVTTAWYHLCAAILGPLEVEPEAASRM